MERAELASEAYKPEQAEAYLLSLRTRFSSEEITVLS